MNKEHDKKTVDDLRIERLPLDLANIKNAINLVHPRTAIDMIDNLLSFYKRMGYGPNS